MPSLPVLIDAEPAPDTTPDSPLFSRERQATFLSALAGTGTVDLTPDNFRYAMDFLPSYRQRRGNLKIRIGKAFLDAV